MAGDWIKVEDVMPDKPEVSLLAEDLGIPHDEVVGKLVRFWIWADQQSVDGNALSVTEAFVDRITFCVGFTKSLEKVGWIKVRKDGFCIPNFKRHNGKSAKTRALAKERMQRKRDADAVTKSAPEKRREEKIKEESKDTCPPLEGSSSADVNTFVEAYHQKINSKSKLTSKAKDKIKSRLQDSGLPQMLQAVDSVSQDSWKMENMKSHGFGIAWFCHSEDRIDTYANLEPRKETSDAPKLWTTPGYQHEPALEQPAAPLLGGDRG